MACEMSRFVLAAIRRYNPGYNSIYPMISSVVSKVHHPLSFYRLLDSGESEGNGDEERLHRGKSAAAGAEGKGKASGGGNKGKAKSPKVWFITNYIEVDVVTSFLWEGAVKNFRESHDYLLVRVYPVFQIANWCRLTLSSPVVQNTTGFSWGILNGRHERFFGVSAPAFC